MIKKFTEKEKVILRKFVELKRKNKLDEFCVGTILKEELKTFALQWQIEPEKKLIVHSNNEKLTLLVQVMDVLCLIEYLEKNNMIKVLNLIDKGDSSKDRFLYNPENISYNPKMDGIKLNAFFEKKGKSLNLLLDDPIYLDCIDLLERYVYRKIIYPLPLIEDFVDNHFKTIEERQFDRQIKEATSQTRISRWALAISISSVVLTVILYLIK